MNKKLLKSIDRLNKVTHAFPDPKPVPEDETGSCCFELPGQKGRWFCLDDFTQKKCKELPNGSWNTWECESRDC